MKEREMKRQEKAVQKEAAKKTKGKQVVLDTKNILSFAWTVNRHYAPVHTSFLVGRQHRGKEQEAITPPTHNAQPAPCFTSADIFFCPQFAPYECTVADPFHGIVLYLPLPA